MQGSCSRRNLVNGDDETNVIQNKSAFAYLKG